MFAQGPLALFSSGRTKGVVFDYGHGFTSISHVYDGHLLPSQQEKIDIAGIDVTKYLLKCLAKIDSYFQNIDGSLDYANYVKETSGYVALDVFKDMGIATQNNSLEKKYKLPDGHKFVVCKERFLPAEGLFHPQLLGLDRWGLHYDLYNSIMKSDIDIRKDFYANIVLSGGSTMFPGLADRMQKELTTLAPNTMKVNVIAPPDRKYSVWIGGYMLASLSTFQQMWISKQECDESGPCIVHRKCP